ncbi:MAG TPA: SIMPL domain-containing protein [Pseudolysinimonas sp.]|nr:SIMPL domain-containing protein [Pseudolysinimonas sp.]
MTSTITVQGSHTAWFDAERATLHVSAAFDGPKRDEVFARATSTAADVTGIITPLFDAEAGPVTWWSSDRVSVWSERPWNNEGKRLPLVYHAAISVQARFRDFDALSRVIEQLAIMDGVNLGGIDWDLTDERRTAVTDEVRTAAVADAIRKAGTYAAAAGLGTPTVVAVADPGMLGDGSSGSPAPAPYERMAFRAQAMDAGGGAPLTLTPEQIQVASSVDVRFSA